MAAAAAAAAGGDQAARGPAGRGRDAYAAKLLSFLTPGSRVLLSSSNFDEAERAGPPFAVRDTAEVRSLYGPPRGWCKVEKLEDKDAMPKKDAGHDAAFNSVLSWKRRQAHLITVGEPPGTCLRSPSCPCCGDGSMKPLSF